MWTDVPALNALIERFLPVARASRWDEGRFSVGRCWEAAIKFSELLEPADFDPEYLEGTPDALGYMNRPRDGFYKFHTVVVAREGCDYFLIDWTASQYGYAALPLVRRLSFDEYLEMKQRCAEMTPPYENEPDWQPLEDEQAAQVMAG